VAGAARARRRLPVTNVGKVDKKKLRDDIAAKLAAETTEGAR
jgi:non-ribosomal peptide synthetase component E (peptide arylation enzyme)